MEKAKISNPLNHTDEPYDNGAIGVIASAGSAGAGIGAALGVGAEITGMAIGATVGGIVGAVVAVAGIEAVKHTSDKKPSKQNKN